MSLEYIKNNTIPYNWTLPRGERSGTIIVRPLDMPTLFAGRLYSKNEIVVLLCVFEPFTHNMIFARIQALSYFRILISIWFSFFHDSFRCHTTVTSSISHDRAICCLADYYITYAGPVLVIQQRVLGDAPGSPSLFPVGFHSDAATSPSHHVLEPLRSPSFREINFFKLKNATAYLFSIYRHLPCWPHTKWNYSFVEQTFVGYVSY